MINIELKLLITMKITGKQKKKKQKKLSWSKFKFLLQMP